MENDPKFKVKKLNNLDFKVVAGGSGNSRGIGGGGNITVNKRIGKNTTVTGHANFSAYKPKGRSTKINVGLNKLGFEKNLGKNTFVRGHLTGNALQGKITGAGIQFEKKFSKGGNVSTKKTRTRKA